MRMAGWRAVVAIVKASFLSRSTSANRAWLSFAGASVLA
jgi:hypothetical protein